jgi:hypothetical protein
VLVAVGVAAAALVGLSTAATGPRSEEAAKAKAAKTVSKPAKQSQAGTVGSSSGAQSANDAARYWTKERMEGARPAGKAVPGGTPRPSGGSSVQGASPSATPERSAPAKKTAAKKRTAKKRASAQADGVTSSPDTAPNAADYWTQDEMDSAQPAMPSPSDPGAPVDGSPPPAPPVGVP